jgi:uncharacterized membrane protein YoaK (UPF0700 family)
MLVASADFLPVLMVIAGCMGREIILRNADNTKNARLADEFTSVISTTFILLAYTTFSYNLLMSQGGNHCHVGQSCPGSFSQHRWG